MANNPINATDITGTLIGGYHYCGPGQDLGNLDPKDRLDAACRVHDACYHNIKISALQGTWQYFIGIKSKKEIQCEKDKCDAALCKAAKHFKAYDANSSMMRSLVIEVFCR